MDCQSTFDSLSTINSQSMIFDFFMFRCLTAVDEIENGQRFYFDCIFQPISQSINQRPAMYSAHFVNFFKVL